MVIETDTSPRLMPSNKRSTSSNAVDGHAQPADFTQAVGWSLSRPISVGRSKAVLRPVWPFASRNLKRPLVSSGVPNPANCRMVHSRPRYILAWTPRVNGNCPG